MTAPPAPSARWRILASLAAISFAAGVAIAAWSDGERGSVTYAAVFGGVLNLTVEGERGVNGFLGAENMAPGDGARGSLVLYRADRDPRDTTDLDVDVRTATPGSGAWPDLARGMVLVHLSYGMDDLLSGADGGVDLLALADLGPMGDRDGRVSLAELDAAGVNDLPPPRTRAEGGTAWVIEVRFAPGPTMDLDDFRGERIDAQFVFYLADSLEADLN